MRELGSNIVRQVRSISGVGVRVERTFPSNERDREGRTSSVPVIMPTGTPRNRSSGDGVGLVAQRIRACGYEPRCRGFESLLAHNRPKREVPFPLGPQGYGTKDYLGPRPRIPSPILTKKLKEASKTEERVESEEERDVEIENASEMKGTK
ncbi:hypothetical protein H5410_064466 [Solanum commersonii]|uniref:Protein TIC 214 n=1 Tax=Solanum commersonii TaxID=4109 RepID=A0A9J5VZG4_SOLCO|nr:hypothetical protein H5410_064466 [Solanum commersonii]